MKETLYAVGTRVTVELSPELRPSWTTKPLTAAVFGHIGHDSRNYTVYLVNIERLQLIARAVVPENEFSRFQLSCTKCVQYKSEEGFAGLEKAIDELFNS